MMQGYQNQYQSGEAERNSSDGSSCHSAHRCEQQGGDSEDFNNWVNRGCEHPLRDVQEAV